MSPKFTPLLQVGLLFLGLQACQVPIAETEAAPSLPPGASTPTDSPASDGATVDNGAEEVELPITLDPLLPALTENDLTRLKETLNVGTESWFALAGLDKAVPPPEFSVELQSYRQAWMASHSDIAPFLGLWHDSEAQNFYFLSVFPSTVPGQVCVLEFKPEWSLPILNEATGEYSYKDVISEQILSFSLATVQAGQLRSSQIRTAEELITSQTFALAEAYPVEVMGVADDQGSERVLAAASPPTLPPDLPEPLQQVALQALADYNCTADLP